MSTVAYSFDVNDEAMRPHLGQPYLIDYLRLHDVDDLLCHRFEILADGDGQLVAHCLDRAVLTETIPSNVDVTKGGWEIDRWGYVLSVPLRAAVPRELVEAYR